MEVLLDWLKLWVPFTGVCVAFFVFGWRVLNRREDKLEARHKESLNQLRENSQQRDDKLETLIKESLNQLRENSQQRDDKLEARHKESLNQLRENSQQRDDKLSGRIRNRNTH